MAAAWHSHHVISGLLISEHQGRPVGTAIHWFWPRPQGGDVTLPQWWTICPAMDEASRAEPAEGLLCEPLREPVSCPDCQGEMELFGDRYDLLEPFCAVRRQDPAATGSPAEKTA